MPDRHSATASVGAIVWVAIAAIAVTLLAATAEMRASTQAAGSAAQQATAGFDSALDVRRGLQFGVPTGAYENAALEAARLPAALSLAPLAGASGDLDVASMAAGPPPGSVTLGLVDGAILSSTDSGTSFKPVFANRDGAITSIAASAGGMLFAAAAGPSVAVSANGGATWEQAAPSAALATARGNDQPGPFPPLAISGNHVLFGAHHVFVSADGMKTWKMQENADLTGGCSDGSCALQQITVAASDSRVAYALSAQSGSAPFKLSQTAQADFQSGAEWRDVTPNLPLDPARVQATSIAIDPRDADDAYLALSGFDAVTHAGHVLRTRNRGATWSRADGVGGESPLPDAPVMTVLVDAADPSGNTILAGTDVGLFHSTDGGMTWAMVPGARTTPVAALAQNAAGRIFVATPGQGAFCVVAETPSAMAAAATKTPKPSPTPTPVGLVTITKSGTNHAGPGVPIASGVFTVKNTSAAAISVTSVTISFSNPGLFDQATLDGTPPSATATVSATVRPLTASTQFSFAAPVLLQPGDVGTFSFTTIISFNPTQGALVSPLRGRPAMLFALALGMVGLVAAPLPARRRRLIALTAGLLVLASAALVGCGNSSNSGTGAPFESSMTITAVGATGTGGGGFNGLPGSLGTISLF